MIPKRPYLLRAFYDWIVENDMTPHIVVNALADEVTVPKQHVKDGKIVLNLSPMAVQDFMVDNDALSFSARFGGVAFYIYCPMHAIEDIYARETPSEGISFSPDEYAQVEKPENANDSAREKTPAPVAVLSTVSSDKDDTDSDVSEPEEETVAASQPDDETPPPRKRPSLRVVK